LALLQCLCAQENNPNGNKKPLEQKEFKSFKERIYVGGNVGAWFGTTTFVNLSPLVGVK